VQGIAEERNRAGHDRDGQFERARHRQPNGADPDGPVGLPPFGGIVVAGVRLGGLAYSGDFVHGSSVPLGRRRPQRFGGAQPGRWSQWW
jgi:hypothetical protein